MAQDEEDVEGGEIRSAVAPAEAGEPHSLDVVAHEWGKIHIQQRVGRKGRQRRQVSQQRRERLYLIVEHADIRTKVTSGERDGNRGDADRDAFHCGGHGPRIQDVLTHVLPMIDPAQNEVGTLGHQRLDG